MRPFQRPHTGRSKVAIFGCEGDAREWKAMAVDPRLAPETGTESPDPFFALSLSDSFNSSLSKAYLLIQPISQATSLIVEQHANCKMFSFFNLAGSQVTTFPTQ